MSIPKSKHDLEYCARMNVFYHEDRERTFTQCARWTAFISVLLSSAAAISLSELFFPEAKADAGRRFALVFGITTVIANAAALAFNWNGQNTLHARLKAKWLAFSMEAHLLDETSHKDFEALLLKLSELNMEEPPPNERALMRAVASADKALGLLRTT